MSCEKRMKHWKIGGKVVLLDELHLLHFCVVLDLLDVLDVRHLLYSLDVLDMFDVLDVLHTIIGAGFGGASQHTKRAPLVLFLLCVVHQVHQVDPVHQVNEITLDEVQ